MDDLLGPLYRLRGAEHIVGVPSRADGRSVELWIGGGSILAVRPEHQSNGTSTGAWAENEPPAIECRGLAILPGLVDLSLHASGDCTAEGGYFDRTPEASLSDLLNAGVTTFVGVLGRDTVSRSPKSLLSKVRGLNKAGGLTGLVCTGAADGAWPPPSLTGSGASNDLALVGEVVASGTFAISDPDHPAGSDTPPADLARACGDCFAASALSGKPGLVYCRVGSGPTGLDPLRDLLTLHFPGGAESGRALSILPIMPPSLVHGGDDDALFEDCSAWLSDGGRVCLSAGTSIGATVAACLRLHRAGARGSTHRASGSNSGSDGRPWPANCLCVASDAFAVLPSASSGSTGGSDQSLETRPPLRYGRPSALLEVVRRLVLEHNLALDVAVAFASSHPAAALRMEKRKGLLRTGADADLLLVDAQSLELVAVIANGRLVKAPGWVTRGVVDVPGGEGSGGNSGSSSSSPGGSNSPTSKGGAESSPAALAAARVWLRKRLIAGTGGSSSSSFSPGGSWRSSPNRSWGHDDDDENDEKTDRRQLMSRSEPRNLATAASEASAAASSFGGRNSPSPTRKAYDSTDGISSGGGGGGDWARSDLATPPPGSRQQSPSRSSKSVGPGILGSPVGGWTNGAHFFATPPPPPPRSAGSPGRQLERSGHAVSEHKDASSHYDNNNYRGRRSLSPGAAAAQRAEAKMLDAEAAAEAAEQAARAALAAAAATATSPPYSSSGRRNQFASSNSSSSSVLAPEELRVDLSRAEALRARLATFKALDRAASSAADEAAKKVTFALAESKSPVSNGTSHHNASTPVAAPSAPVSASNSETKHQRKARRGPSSPKPPKPPPGGPAPPKEVPHQLYATSSSSPAPKHHHSSSTSSIGSSNAAAAAAASEALEALEAASEQQSNTSSRFSSPLPPLTIPSAPELPSPSLPPPQQPRLKPTLEGLAEGALPSEPSSGHRARASPRGGSSYSHSPNSGGNSPSSSSTGRVLVPTIEEIAKSPRFDYGRTSPKATIEATVDDQTPPEEPAAAADISEASSEELDEWEGDVDAKELVARNSLPRSGSSPSSSNDIEAKNAAPAAAVAASHSSLSSRGCRVKLSGSPYIAEIPAFRGGNRSTTGDGQQPSLRPSVSNNDTKDNEDEEEEEPTVGAFANDLSHEDEEERRSEARAPSVGRAPSNSRAPSQGRAPSSGRSNLPLPFAPAPMPSPSTNPQVKLFASSSPPAAASQQSSSHGGEPRPWGEATTSPPPEPYSTASSSAVVNAEGERGGGSTPPSGSDPGSDEDEEYAHYRLLVFSSLAASRRRVDSKSSPRSGSSDRNMSGAE